MEDITSTIKQIILNQRQIQGTSISDSDLLTRYKFTTGSLGLRPSGVEVAIYGRTLGSSFILGNEVTGSIVGGEIVVLGRLGSNTGSLCFLGDSRSTFFLQWSGG